MTTLDKIETLLPQLTSQERARLASLLMPSRIQRTPGVNGNSASVRRTRIAVWLLEETRREGADDSQLLEMYPALSLEDLNAAWHYVAQNLEEIERDIQENEQA